MQDRFRFRCWKIKEGKYRDGLSIFDYQAGIVNPRNNVLEQCTGLKDKNGKLIFEGDIIKSPYGEVLYMFWKDGAWWAREPKRGISSHDSVFFYECCEIIGNIHENHELLEQSNERD